MTRLKLTPLSQFKGLRFYSLRYRLLIGLLVIWPETLIIYRDSPTLPLLQRGGFNNPIEPNISFDEIGQDTVMSITRFLFTTYFQIQNIPHIVSLCQPDHSTVDVGWTCLLFLGQFWLNFAPTKLFCVFTVCNSYVTQVNPPIFRYTFFQRVYREDFTPFSLAFQCWICCFSTR